jgi:mono/diheme cytochrome c family protein
MVKRIVMWAGLVVMVLVAACGDDDADTTTQSPVTTQAATTTTRAATVGDPERGRQIWDDGAGGPSGGCSGCHSLDGSEKVATQRAPSWQGISGRAGDRVPGLSAEEYLRESIVDPAAYIVEGYLADAMPKGFKILLSEEDIGNLVAFLLTL